MIRQMGFVDYFLIVSDFIGYAKSHGIPVGPGRGSAAGSMVAYCLDITDVDPIKYDLLLRAVPEPGAGHHAGLSTWTSAIRRRDEVIDYVSRKYGADHVAQIVTFGTMAAQGGHPGRGPGPEHPLRRGGRTSPSRCPTALHMTLDTALTLSKPLRELYEGDPQVQELIDTGPKGLEGMPRHASTHAAGVVITRQARWTTTFPWPKTTTPWSPSTP